MLKEKSLQISVIDKSIGILYAFILFLLMEPYFMWNTGKLSMYLSMIIILITALYFRNLQKKDLIIIPLFIYCFIYMYSYTNLFGLIGKSAILSILFLKESKVLYYLKLLKKIMAIVFFISFITYILVIILSLPIAHNLISPLNALKGSAYTQYPFLLLEHSSNVKVLNIRFCSVFEEPGTVGSFAAMFLFADNYKLKSKENIIIFIAGLLSMSFFFYVCSFIYFLYLSKFRMKIIYTVIILSLFFGTRNNAAINYLIWDRFTIEDGKVKGDNRSSINLDETYTDFLKSEDVLWGRGTIFLENNEFMNSSSYKMTIISYGIVFFVLYCLSFLLLAIFTIKIPKYIIAYFILFIGMIYQRPGIIYYPAYIFVLIATIYSLKQVAIKNKSKKYIISKLQFKKNDKTLKESIIVKSNI